MRPKTILSSPRGLLPAGPPTAIALGSAPHAKHCGVIFWGSRIADPLTTAMFFRCLDDYVPLDLEGALLLSRDSG